MLRPLVYQTLCSGALTLPQTLALACKTRMQDAFACGRTHVSE